jgi:hypothetical protein
MINSDWQQGAVSSRVIRPARLWYWVAAAALTGAVACVALGVAGLFTLNHQIKDFQRISVPGQGELTFARPGQYVLYIERPGGCCSTSEGSGNGASAPFPGWSMRLGLRPADGGPPVSVSEWRGAAESYDAAGHQGQAAMSVTIDEPGSYVLRTEDITPRSITDIAAGPALGHGIAIPILLFLVGLLIMTPAALVAGGITFSLRHRARRLLTSPALPAAGWQPDPVGRADPAWLTGHQTWDGTGQADQALGQAAPASLLLPSGIGTAAPDTILVGFAGPAKQNRLTVLVRLILAIPHFIGLYFAAIAAQVVLVIGWFGALFTGQLPQFAADYLSGYLRWKIRLYAYLLLLTDSYPPFMAEDHDYPVRIAVRPGRLHRLAVLFRLILAIPFEIVGELVTFGVTTIVALITWLIVLITGRMPRPLYQAIAAAVRYQARVRGYLYMLTSQPPQGLFGDQPASWPAADCAGLRAAGPQTAGAPPPVPGAAPAGSGPLRSAPDQRSWTLMLSGPAKALVCVFISIGALLIISPVILGAVTAAAAPAGPAATALGPPATTRPRATAVPAPAPATPAPVPTDTAPAAINTGPRPLTSGQQAWLNGLYDLQTHMNSVMPGSGDVTSAFLRGYARILRGCSPRLASLGPATGPARPVYRLASRGCAQFEHGAACAAAAARIPFGPTGQASRKLSQLINCGFAHANRGSSILDQAVARGDDIQVAR